MHFKNTDLYINKDFNNLRAEMIPQFISDELTIEIVN